jgi:hypothetical protein
VLRSQSGNGIWRGHDLRASIGALEEVTDANPVPNFGALETYSDTAQIGELSP